MIGLGTAINVAAVVAGSALGAVAGHRLSERTHVLIMDVLGLISAVNGALALRAVASPDFVAAVGNSWTLMVVLGSLLVGGLIGSALKIETRMEQLGERLKRRYARDDDSDFAVGFFTASLIFCIGPLAIMGSFDDAFGLGIDKLLLKSIMDGFASIAFAASFGWGVAFSALAIGIYQGGLTLLGLALGSIWSTAQIDGMTAVGGVMLLAIALRLLKVREIAVGDLLPALFVAPILVGLIAQFS